MTMTFSKCEKCGCQVWTNVPLKSLYLEAPTTCEDCTGRFTTIRKAKVMEVQLFTPWHKVRE
jgi:hypothetical protein